MREHAADASRLLKALANDKRLTLLCLMVEGEQSVGELNAQVDLSQSALSQHLAVLREADLVHVRRDGRQVYYSLNQDEVAVCCGRLMLNFAPERTQSVGVDVPLAAVGVDN